MEKTQINIKTDCKNVTRFFTTTRRNISQQLEILAQNLHLNACSSEWKELEGNFENEFKKYLHYAFNSEHDNRMRGLSKFDENMLILSVDADTSDQNLRNIFFALMTYLEEFNPNLSKGIHNIAIERV